MRALSIRQPWLHAILLLGKDVENRQWTTSFRGRILLHASKECTRAEYEDAREFIEDRPTLDGTESQCRIPSLADLPRGALVGAATIIDCVQDYDSPWFCGPWGLVLEDVVALPKPVPCKGALGFWRVPPDVAKQCGSRETCEHSSTDGYKHYSGEEEAEPVPCGTPTPELEPLPKLFERARRRREARNELRGLLVGLTRKEQCDLLADLLIVLEEQLRDR